MTVEPTFVMAGSILAGTAEHRLVSIETHLEVTAAHGADEIGAVVEQAERMCFVLDAIEGRHTVNRRSSLNGEPLSKPR